MTARGVSVLVLAGVALCAAPARRAWAQETPPKDKPLAMDGVAAVVGTQVILISEVMAGANQARASGAQVTSARELARLEKDVLDQLIEVELLVQKAKEEKVEAAEPDIQRQVDETEKRARSNFKSESEFRQALKEAGFGALDEWRKLQADQVRRQQLQRDVVQKLRRDGKMTAVNVSEREVTEAFEANRTKLPRKEARVGLRQVVIATTPSAAAKARARARIDSLHKELEAHPEDFETMAKRESMDPGSRELGGDLGWNRRGRMVPEFDRMMFALNPGALSPVVETTFGFHIIRVDRVQPAEVKARHILIRPMVDSSDERRARQLADSVAAAWRTGGSYDSLSAKFHDEAGGEDRTIPEYPRSELPEAYRNALEGAGLNAIVGPFPIPDVQGGTVKQVVAQVTFLDEAGEYTLPEMRERIREQLAQERSMRRLIDALKKQTYVAVKYDPMALVEPER